MSAASRVAMALFVLTILTVIPYVFLRSDAPTEYKRMQGEVATMQTRNAELKRENELARQRLSAFRTNPRLIERQARERLHLARPDEVLFVFEEEPTVPAGMEAAPAP